MKTWRKLICLPKGIGLSPTCPLKDNSKVNRIEQNQWCVILWPGYSTQSSLFIHSSRSRCPGMSNQCPSWTWDSVAVAAWKTPDIQVFILLCHGNKNLSLSRGLLHILWHYCQLKRTLKKGFWTVFYSSWILSSCSLWAFQSSCSKNSSLMKQKKQKRGKGKQTPFFLSPSIPTHYFQKKNTAFFSMATSCTICHFPCH